MAHGHRTGGIARSDGVGTPFGRNRQTAGNDQIPADGKYRCRLQSVGSEEIVADDTKALGDSTYRVTGSDCVGSRARMPPSAPAGTRREGQL